MSSALRPARSHAIRLAPLVAAAAVLAGCDDGLTNNPVATSSMDPGPDQLMEQGKVVYGTSCLMCHQHDGGGVPNLQPPVAGSEMVLAEDPTQLVKAIYLGIGDPNDPRALPSSGEWMQVMNGFSHLSETEIAAVATYVRGSFGNDAAPVTVPEVRRIVRALPSREQAAGDDTGE